MRNPISECERSNRGRYSSTRQVGAHRPSSRLSSRIGLLFVCLLLLGSTSAVAQTKSESQAIDELRKVVEAQQRLIEAQQKRLEALESSMESVKRPGTAVTARHSVETAPAIAEPAVEATAVEKSAPSAVVNQAKPGSDITREGFGLKFYGFL